MSIDLIPLDAERAVLGSVLADNALDWEAVCMPEDFGTPSHQHIFRAMLALKRRQQPIDHLTLSEALKETGQLNGIGGPAYLMALDQSTPITYNLPAYAATVREYAARRAMIASAQALMAGARDLGKPPEMTAQEATAALEKTHRGGKEEPSDIDLSELADDWAAFFDRMQQNRTGLDDGVRLLTGIEQLDAKGEGQVNNLNVLLGLASKGKTAIAAEIIWNWLSHGIPGGILGLEDGTKWLTRRHLSRHLGIPVNKVGRTLLHDHQYARFTPWMEKTREMYLKHLRIHRSGGLHATDLLAIVRKWIAGGARWIWIDHGLRVDYSGSAGTHARYDMLIGRTLDTLANLGEKHRVSINVNWHLNRVSEENARPTMAMAKESGYLEATARKMEAVWEQEGRPGMALVTCLKNTEGQRDWTVALERDAEHALVKSKGGYEVDFAGEAAAAKQAAKEAREATKQRTKLFDGGRP